MPALVPAEQRTVDFYGTELIAIRDVEGDIWVPLRRLCEAIGVNFSGQLNKIQADPVMGEQLETTPVTLSDGRTFEMECLSLKYVRAWLFGINANRVKEEVRERLIQYQREVIEIIDRAFSHNLPERQIDEAVIVAMHENALQQAKIWETVLQEQRRLRSAEELLQEHDDLIWDAFNQIGELRQKQSQLTARFNDVTHLLPAPSDVISPAQKASIKELVDDIVAAAQEKGIRLGQGRNDYPAVWGAFKQRFDVAKYDEITVAQYDEALSWLKGWLDRIRGS